MKVVFLDIDGVLNCAETPNPKKFPYVIDQQLLDRLRKLILRSGAVAVLSSTWRYDPIGLLAAQHYGIPYIDVTPDLPHRPRRDEIQMWLESRHVSRFIVLDDEDDELDELPLFQPNAKIGLDPATQEAAVLYLNGESDKDMRRSKVVDSVQDVANAIKGHKG